MITPSYYNVPSDKILTLPRIGAKEYTILREFSNFLLPCINAVPHIKGLQIMNNLR